MQSEELQLRGFQKKIGCDMREKGLLEDGTHPSQFIALIHSEVSEVLEEFRKGTPPREVSYDVDGKPLGIPFELADIVLRTIIMAEYYGIDLERVIIKKAEYNKTRPYKNGKLF